jgi:hypothetical protein
MIIAALGIIDILSAITLLFPNFLGFGLGVISLLKGLSSMIGFFSADLMIVALGVIDIVTGILLLTGFGLPWFWLIIMFKGIISVLSGLGG